MRSSAVRRLVIGVATLALALHAAPARADKCVSAKLKAVAKQEAGLLSCQSTAAKKGDSSGVAACVAKVNGKFTKAFAKAGACSGVAADCTTIATDCSAQVRSALPDGTSSASKCEAARLKAAGKKAQAKLTCWFKAAQKDVAVDDSPGGCLDKAAAKFTTAFNKVSGCSGDGATASVEALIDGECVAQQVTASAGVVSAICVTTTTTTTTTTSSTTTTLICGNGSVDANETCDAPGSSCGGTSTCGSDCRCTCTADSCPCDYLGGGAACLFPFPNDFFTVADATTATGRRVHFSTQAMPQNASHVAIDTTEYNRSDGFSAGATILLHVPNLDLGMTGASPVTDIGRSLDSDSPTVIVNATTLAHHLHFAELDANATSEATRALILHPSINFDEGQRYIVALRNLKDASGNTIPAPADFAAFRDGTPTGDPVKEARRAHMDDLFDTLTAAGVDTASLYLAWDFTVASSRNNTERLLFMRDDAFVRLGTAPPSFSVTEVDNDYETVATNRIYRRVVGTYQVPRYVSSESTGATMVLDANGLPTHLGSQTANFICIIPRAALADASSTAVPARPSLYGHGLLGSASEVTATNVKNMAQEHDFVFCATDWIGMASDDVPTAVGILGELGQFPKLTDRLQQAMVDQLFLARLMIHATGFVSDPAFQDGSGNPVIDTSEVYYDGNSQGGIFGGTVMAIAQDITRGVLGVTGMNYSLLLTRSTDFALYASVLYPAYPNEFNRPLGLALIQMLWDRSDPNGYARHIMNDPLPNTPSHKVLMHEAFGDHQVANVAAEIEARTIGVSDHQPVIAAGRSYEVTPHPFLPGIASYPFDGSALVLWDSGAATPPTTNTAPQTGNDPHSDPRNSVAARTQKSEFLKPTGAVVDVCSGAPCVAP